MAKCPKCQNTIGSGVRGAEGVDENNDPIPFWSEDPILTPLGLAGDSYRGHTAIKVTHIRELQNYYGALETLLELPTITTWLEAAYSTQLSHAHLNQIRIAIESILSASGQTIEDYFQHDRLGNIVVTSQTEWTDVTRTEVEGYPLIPDEIAIKAIHIEELRRGVLAGITNAILIAFDNASGQNAYANYSVGDNSFFINTDLTNAYNLSNMRYVEVHFLQHDKISIFDEALTSWLSNDELTLTDSWSDHMTSNINFMTIDYYYEGLYCTYVYDLYWISTEPISTDVGEEEHDYVFYAASRYTDNFIDKFTCPWKKNIGTGDGSTSQVVSTSRTYPSLVPNSNFPITFNNTEMYIYVGGELWERVDSLSGQTADAKVCTISASLISRTGTAEVTFGDGSEGAIPATDASIVIEFAIGVSILWTHEAEILSAQSNSTHTRITAVDGVRNSLFVNINEPYTMRIGAYCALDIYDDRIELTLKDESKVGAFTNPTIYAKEFNSANDSSWAWGNKTLTSVHSFRKQYWFDIYNSLFGESVTATPTTRLTSVIKRFVSSTSPSHTAMTINNVDYDIHGSGASTTVDFPYTNFFGITQADWLANYSYVSRTATWVRFDKGLGGNLGGMTLLFGIGNPPAIQIYGAFLPGATETIESSEGYDITYHDLDDMIDVENWDTPPGDLSSSGSAFPISFNWWTKNNWWNDKLYKYNSVDDLTLLSTISARSQGEKGLFTVFKSGDNGFKLYVVDSATNTYDGHTKATGDNYTHLYETEDGITWTSPSVNKGRAYDATPVDLGAYVPTLFITKNLTVIDAWA